MRSKCLFVLLGCLSIAPLLKGQAPISGGAHWAAIAHAQFENHDSLKASLNSLKKAHFAFLGNEQIQEAIKTAVQISERYFIVRARNTLAKARDSSYSWMDRSFRLYQKWPDSVGPYRPTIFRRRGDILKKKGALVLADSFLTQAIILKRKSNPHDTDFFIGCFYSKYLLAHRSNRLNAAKKVLDSIRPYCLSPAHPRRYFAHQNLSGRYSYMLGQPEKSVAYFTEASKVADQAYGKNSRQKLLAYDDLYKSYKLLGNKEQSKAYLLKGIEVAQTRNDEDIRFNLIYSLSAVYYDENKYRKALTHLKELEAQVNTELSERTLMSFQRQPIIYHMLGNSDSAQIAAIKLARSIDQVKGNERDLMVSKSACAKSLADYFRMTEQYDLAIKYAQIGIDDVLKLKGRESAKCSRYSMMARIYQSIDSFKQAAFYGTKALSFYQTAGNSEMPLENEYEINAITLNGYRFLSETYRMKYAIYKDSSSLYYFREYSKKVLDCINEMNGVIPSGKSKREYRDKYKVHSENILYTLQESLRGEEHPKPAPAAELLRFIERAKSQELRWKITSDEVLSQNMGLPDSLKYRLMYLKAIIANQERSLLSITDSLRKTRITDELIDLRDGLKILSLKIRDEYPSFYHHFYQPQKVVLSEILKSLPKNQTVIDFFVGYETVYALGFNHENLIFKELGPTDSLKTMVTHFNRGIAKSDIEKFKKSASELYQWLLTPFADLGLKRMIIVPDGMLYSLAFDALTTEQSEAITFATLPYAIKKHFITLCYTVNDLIPQPKAATGDERTSLLAMGRSFDNDNEKHFAYLPKAIDETTFSAGLFKSSLQFQNDMATEHLFKQRASNAEIIHCATHALVDQENPLNSVLVLAGDTLEDGMLHLHEMLNLNLNSSLVVLSACNTGSGYVDTTEGVISLGYAIAYAGCPNSMMTLWSSPDISNSEIVKSTMKLVSEGINFDKALHQAKLDFLNSADPVMASPLYWSALNYTGKPDFGIDRPNPYWFLLATLIPFLLLGFALYRYRS